ncbi:MAG TPA: MBL fold metallo-hydrolase [Acidimicrobiales bacterium]|nr:MBL fold metallo-hydrolase [Acidimicrobiales bacterium]
MTTEVILTGTGVPHPRPGRAGAGALVRHGEVALQFDAGRATVLRLMEAGTPPHALTAVFLTRVHSDHVVGLPDLAMTRWIQQQLARTGPLVVVAAEGMAARFVRRMLEPYDDDIAIRIEHVGATPIEVTLESFDVPTSPEVVWSSEDGGVRVLAVAVHHEPVPEAVAYRVETSDAIVVVSGDTRVCSEVEHLAVGADVLVHEACRTSAMAPMIAGTVFETIFNYHADTVELGAMAARAGVPHIVLTHLIPPPEAPADAEMFVQDLREGGYQGHITVGEDLTTISL